MKKTYNRYNHKNNKGLTPRQRQMVLRKVGLLLSTLVVAIILTVFISGLCSKAKAADNYNKYYTSVAIMPGDTISEYYETYGEHYKNINQYIEEVCMINSIDPDHLKAGNYIIIPYYSLENK